MRVARATDPICARPKVSPQRFWISWRRKSQLRVGEERIALKQGERVAAGFGDDRRVAENLPTSSGIGRRKAARASRPHETALS